MTESAELKHFFSEIELHKAFKDFEDTKRDKFDEDIVKIPMGADGITYEDFR